MQLSEAEVAKTWDDTTFTESILKKGQRRSKPIGALVKATPMLCSNCHLPISLKSKPRCHCSIWDVGKRA